MMHCCCTLRCSGALETAAQYAVSVSPHILTLKPLNWLCTLDILNCVLSFVQFNRVRTLVFHPLCWSFRSRNTLNSLKDITKLPTTSVRLSNIVHAVHLKEYMGFFKHSAPLRTIFVFLRWQANYTRGDSSSLFLSPCCMLREQRIVLDWYSTATLSSFYATVEYYNDKAQ